MSVGMTKSAASAAVAACLADAFGNGAKHGHGMSEAGSTNGYFKDKLGGK
jgi:hypothetical protein